MKPKTISEIICSPNPENSDEFLHAKKLADAAPAMEKELRRIAVILVREGGSITCLDGDISRRRILRVLPK